MRSSLALLPLLLGLSLIPATAAAGPAPPFSLRSLDGRPVRLSDYRGRAVVVDFWATWCKPCRASMPHLNQIQERYGARLVVVGISIDDGDVSTVRRFTEDLGIRFRIAMATERVLDAYGPFRAMPTTFFINRSGEVKRRVVGYIDPETLDGYVRELF